MSQALDRSLAVATGPTQAHGHHLVAESHGCSEKPPREAVGSLGDRRNIKCCSATETLHAGGVGLEGYP